VLGRDHHRHADAAVEHAVHLAIGDLAFALQPLEERRHRPRRARDRRFHGLGQDARQVFHQAAPRDMRHALQRHLPHQREQRLHVDARGLEHHSPKRPAVKIRTEIGLRPLEDLADERVAVGMRAARGEPEHRVAGPDAAAVHDRAFLHHPDRESGEVVSPSAYIPGISAVSPPMSAQPASSQPRAMPLTTSVATATSSLPHAK